MKNLGKKLSLCLLFAILIISLTGCATIFSSSSKDISIDSEPRGADITINGMSSGITPAVVPLAKDRSHIVVISKEGYQPTTVAVKNKIGVGWLVLDVFSGGLPIIVDAISGDWKTLKPTKIFTHLLPSPQ